MTTLEKTTYYLVYHYKNNGNQDDQQGLTFSGTINVSIINAKSSYCELHPETGACKILAIGETEELKFDETSDNNLRYIGADPNNYVKFNDELWRIIGVMNNIDDGTGNKETRLKIIRSEPIGNYSWDNKGDNGENDWSTSPLQHVLNSGAYWNRTSGECPYGQNGATTPCDFSSIGLTETAKAMISNAVWNLGGLSSDYNLVSTFYIAERGDTVYSGKPTKWIGQIGLMYPSDYGYATNGGNTNNRETCLLYALHDWVNYNDCYSNDWLYTSSHQWTITPRTDGANIVFNADGYGYVNTHHVYYTYLNVVPTLYLSSNVKITSGTGTSSDPFKFSL